MKAALRLTAYALLLPLLLGVLIVLAFGPTVDAPFLFDDFEGIVRNENVRALSPAEGESLDWAAAFTAPAGTGASGRPLVALSLAADHARGGMNPAVFRTTNLALLYLGGLCLTLLAFFAARARMAASQYGRELAIAALLAAALWIAHPLHGAAVHQIVYRGELMMALALFSTLLFAQLGFSKTASDRRWLALSVFTCALGMLSKENMAAAPLLCLLWDRAQHSTGTILGRLRARPVYYASLAGTWLLLGLAWSTGDRGEAVGLGARGLTSLQYLGTQASVVASYSAWALLPFDLAFDYSDWTIATSLFDNWVEGALVLALLALCIIATRRRSLLGLGGLGAFFVLAPTSTIIPIAVSIAAEHRLTAPLAAVTAALSFGGLALTRRRGRGAGLICLSLLLAFLFFLVTGSRERNALFAEPTELWSNTVRLRPQNLLARTHLIEELQRSDRVEEALREIEASLGVNADQPEVRWNQGMILAGLNRTEESQETLRAALAQDENLAPKQMHEAMRAWSEGRVADALLQLRICLQLDPDLARRERLGSVSLQAARAFAIAQEEHLFDPALSLEIVARLPQDDLRVMEARAAALAGLARFGEAEQLLKEALAFARSQRNQRAVSRLSGDAKRYAEGRIERRPVTR